MSATTGTPTRPALVIEAFAEKRSNSLRGFCKVALASGLIIHDVSIHTSNGKAWASPPSKPMLDRDGHAMRDGDGKVRYTPILGFATKEHRDRFSEMVVTAVRQAHPEALS
jgi:hypothetical protein